jgi:virginiamycin B lyase
MRFNLAEGVPHALILTMALTMLGCSRPSADAERTNISGVVQDEARKPVAGVLVKVIGGDSGLTFMVISDAEGRYSTPGLIPGNYTVQAFGSGYQSDRAGPAGVSRGEPAEMDVVLSTPRPMTPPDERMTFGDYEKLMPEGEGKKLITSRCIFCHSLDRIVPTRHSPQDWEKAVDRMRWFIGERSDLRKRYNFGPLSDRERNVIWAYLAKNFGPDNPPLPQNGSSDPNRHLPRTPLEGAEAKYLAMELDLRAAGYEIGVDSQGKLWLTEEGTGNFGYFDPTTLSYSRMTAPTGSSPRSLAQIAEDPEGQIWILDNGPTPDAELLRYNPKTREFSTYRVPAPPRLRAPLNTLRFVDGNIWGTGNSSSRIVKLDPATGKITEYPVPKGSHPYGIAIGGEKTIWYTGNYDDAVVKLDPSTGKLATYRPPTRRAGLRRMAADSEGNLWVAAQDTDKLLRVDYRTGEMVEYAVPTKASGPYAVDVDTKRNLIWFSERDTDKIGLFDPRANSFVEFALPSADTEPRRILVDPTNPNRIWWGGASVGYLEVIE